MYSLEQLLALPPYSLIISLFLISSFDSIGLSILNFFEFIGGKKDRWLRWQACIVGAMFFAIILYPLVLANLTTRFFFQIFAICCVFLGAFHLYQITKSEVLMNLKNSLKSFWSYNSPNKLLIIMLLGMGFVAMGPSTNADALDYHLGVAISILNNGGAFLAPEWVTSRLAGNGETLNSLGLSLGAEQFGSLLQFASLLGIVGIFQFTKSEENKYKKINNFFRADLIQLAIFSTPVLLFLISSSKPQMWPIAMNLFAMSLIVNPSRRNLLGSKALIDYSFICALIMTAALAKFNYQVGSFFVGILSLISMTKRGYFWQAIFITLISGMLILAIPLAWKASVYNASLFEILSNPLPGQFPFDEITLKNLANNADVESSFFFPLSILIPSNLTSYTLLLGIGWIVFFGLKPGKDFWLSAIIFTAFFYMTIILLFAPPNARNYLEPYFWLLIVLKFQANQNESRVFSIIKWPILGQTLLSVAVIWYGVLSLFPGALTPVWRKYVMANNANGYQLMQWADEVLPKNAILLNTHRSAALVPRDSFQYSGYIDYSQTIKAKIYIDRLKQKKVTHALIIGNNDYLELSKCLGKEITKPFKGFSSSRNPFSRKIAYEAHIMEFKIDKFPACLSDSDKK